MDLGIRGRVAIATGASTGIGLAVARLLLKDGAPMKKHPEAAMTSQHAIDMKTFWIFLFFCINCETRYRQRPE
jgi:hypothetical protein